MCRGMRHVESKDASKNYYFLAAKASERHVRLLGTRRIHPSPVVELIFKKLSREGTDLRKVSALENCVFR